MHRTASPWAACRSGGIETSSTCRLYYMCSSIEHSLSFARAFLFFPLLNALEIELPKQIEMKRNILVVRLLAGAGETGYMHTDVSKEQRHRCRCR